MEDILILFLVLVGTAIPILINIMLSFMFRKVARQKGHFEARYFWIPFFFGIVGYILVAALPDRGVQNVVQVQPVQYAAPDYGTAEYNNNQY